eukprot:CAMPEP_0169139220 /NCGR_PEP_ID=MMETSP1015-20121227/42827_1 /TAXON_ID=342587 /ORGANISM="Karlodinium micrum, Strain CCMP2283" /LENGTH=397 /DNA_ID=CAMNT_0009204859 /DNA_START=79 /DNA_END=1272 /DNA_ORIENTATION=+
MTIFATIFACLACISYSRRVQTSIERLVTAPPVAPAMIAHSNQTEFFKLQENQHVSPLSLVEIRPSISVAQRSRPITYRESMAMLVFLLLVLLSVAVTWKSNAKHDEADYDWSCAAQPDRNDAEKILSNAAYVSSSLTKVVACLSSGEVLAEVVMCVNSTVDDLAAAVLKKASIKVCTHIISMRHNDVDLVGNQVLRDLGMKPLLHASVIVTVHPKQTLKISFQPSDAPTADGYLIDSGIAFCDHKGLQYGWSHDNTDGCRKRARLEDPILDSFVIPDRAGKHGRSFHWKIVLEPGEYEVTLGFSDPHPLYGRKDGNAGRLNGSPFDAGKGSPHKELKRDVLLLGRELRLEGSYATGLSAPSYIHICGGSLPRDESKGEISHDVASMPSSNLNVRKL